MAKVHVVAMRRSSVSFGLVVVLGGILLGTLALQAGAGGPVYHGKLTIRPGKGRINPDGNAEFQVRRWDFLAISTTNGIAPTSEPVVIAVAEEAFRIPAGKLQASRSGKRFVYRDKTASRGVRLFRLQLGSDGMYRVRFSLVGVDLSRLLLLDRPARDCLPFAVIIGDDDGFSGVKFELLKPSPSMRLTIPGFCTDVAAWPWA